MVAQNRNRLLARDIPPRLFGDVTVDARRRGLLSDDHFTGRCSEAWASHKRFRARGGRRGWRTGHVLIENRYGLVLDTDLTPADGYSERDAALGRAERIPTGHRVTIGADKAHDMREVVEARRAMDAPPPVARYPGTQHPGSAIDARTTRHPGYATSQTVR